MSLSGLEDIADFRDILQSLLGGNAEYNAVVVGLLEIVKAWPTLPSVVRAKILKLVHKLRR